MESDLLFPITRVLSLERTRRWKGLRLAPPPPPHPLWAGQETGKQGELQVQRQALSVEGGWASSKHGSLCPGQAMAGVAAEVKALKGTVCLRQ